MRLSPAISQRRFPGLRVMGMLLFLAVFLLITDAGCFWQDVCHFNTVEAANDACGTTVLVLCHATRLATHITPPLSAALLSCGLRLCPVPITWYGPSLVELRPCVRPFRICFAVRGPPFA